MYDYDDQTDNGQLRACLLGNIHPVNPNIPGFAEATFSYFFGSTLQDYVMRL